ncbi:hypothetical protein [Clostridium coskatii]|uniref:Uncharacterized protein n=1 Tax=Clostridium coskatii TaxID=1705578 RepID=A0A168PVX6_9CLOT|nr:hypothetical protein [Clostridium coskatii]OAA88335.1 hypothetical protein WX73_02624 [Clostridium coskatii]OBR93681.1 hypothetical protein CLCOS_22890 [Clostridium coskatii]
MSQSAGIVLIIAGGLIVLEGITFAFIKIMINIIKYLNNKDRHH